MDLPFHLKALPPEALDVLRYFGTLDEPVSHAGVISDEVGLSERTFGKVIRRLVTKGYLQMDGDQAYRLSDSGQDAVDELLEYDAAFPGDKSVRKAPVQTNITRRIVVAVANPLVAGQATPLHLGFYPASADQSLDQSADVVVRLTLINAEPTRPLEAVFQLGDEAETQSFSITAGQFKQVRLKAQVFQLGPNPDDINVCGGMYVDLDVVSSSSSTPSLSAYAADITLTKEAD